MGLVYLSTVELPCLFCAEKWAFRTFLFLLIRLCLVQELMHLRGASNVNVKKWYGSLRGCLKSFQKILSGMTIYKKYIVVFTVAGKRD